jgi:hypothetical protein
MRPLPVSRAVLATLVLIVAGCAGSGGGGGGGGTSSPGCKAPPPDQRTVSFKSNIQPIFDRSCALPSCHVTGSLGGNLDLTPGRSYQQLVDRPAFELPKKIRVKPGDPEGSYLVMKVEGAPGIAGLPMPQGCPVPPPGGQCLGPDDLPAIKTWIQECATNN